MENNILLEDKHNSILIVNERDNNSVVIGVPHHAPLGVSELPCPDHPDSDENAGYLGDYIARLLNCSSVIACNYFLDVNKKEDTDYFKRVHSWKPKLLVEIHGHGGHSAKFDIEVSSGSNKRSVWSKTFAEILRKNLSVHSSMEEYTISGDYNKIHFKASKSASITSLDWVPFHIELPKSIRAEKSKSTIFCECVADAINEVLSSYDELAK